MSRNKDVDVLAGSGAWSRPPKPMSMPNRRRRRSEGLLGEEALVAEISLAAGRSDSRNSTTKVLKLPWRAASLTDSIRALSSILEVLRCSVLIDKLLSKPQETLLLCLVTSSIRPIVLTIVLESVPCWAVAVCIGSSRW